MTTGNAPPGVSGIDLPGGRLAAPLALIVVTALPVGVAHARDIAWSRVMNASPSRLSGADRARAARLMNTIQVTYGCLDTIANCLVSHPKCQTARRLAGLVVRVVQAGRSDSEAVSAVRLRQRSVHPKRTHRFNLTNRPRFGASAARATVTIVEFSDFECPFCRVVSPILKRIVTRLQRQGVCLIYKHYPVSSHRQAQQCAQAAFAAHRLGRFWAYHDLLYKKAPRLAPARLEGYARDIGLDLDRFKTIRDETRTRLVIAADKREGLRAGVTGTPTLFVNGKRYRGRKDHTELLDRIEEEIHLLGGGT